MLLNTLLLVAAAVSLSGSSAVLAAPTTETSPDNGSTAGTVTSLTLTKRSTQRYHPDPAVRFASSRDERLATRMMHKEFLSDTGREQLERDIDKLHQENTELRKRGGITLTGWARDWGYTVPMQMGTPPQTVEVTIATGVADFWVYTGCIEPQDCSRKFWYDSTLSSSFRSSSEAFTVHYGGTSSAEGMSGFDDVSVGESKVSSLHFGHVNTTYDFPANANVTGVMGFGWDPSSSIGAVPFWRHVVSQWREPVFSLYLQRQTTFNSGGGHIPTSWGSMLLGDVDPTLYQGDINYVPVDFKAFPKRRWHIPIQGISVGDKAINIGAIVHNQRYAVINCGVTFMTGPRDIVAEIYGSIPGSVNKDDTYYFPCDTFPRIDLTFTFGGIPYLIDNSDMIDTALATSFLLETKVITARQAGDTKRWFQGTLNPWDRSDNDNYPGWSLGATFMKNMYTVFRSDPPAVGLAKLAPTADKKVDPSLLLTYLGGGQ